MPVLETIALIAAALPAVLQIIGSVTDGFKIPANARLKGEAAKLNEEINKMIDTQDVALNKLQTAYNSKNYDRLAQAYLSTPQGVRLKTLSKSKLKDFEEYVEEVKEIETQKTKLINASNRANTVVQNFEANPFADVNKASSDLSQIGKEVTGKPNYSTNVNGGTTLSHTSSGETIPQEQEELADHIGITRYI